jgi:hypothetical protein
LIGHRLDESVEDASRHRQLVHISIIAHQRFFGFGFRSMGLAS